MSGLLALGSRRGYVGREVERRVDQSHVRECLRKVPDQAAGHRIVLLGQQAHVIAQREQTLEQSARLVLVSWRAGRLQLADGQGQTDPERRPPARPALDLDPAAMRRDDPAHDEETEPQARNVCFEGPTRRNGSNRRCWSSTEMPIPWSAIEMTTSDGVRVTAVPSARTDRLDKRRPKGTRPRPSALRLDTLDHATACGRSLSTTAPCSGCSTQCRARGDQGIREAHDPVELIGDVGEGLTRLGQAPSRGRVVEAAPMSQSAVRQVAVFFWNRKPVIDTAQERDKTGEDEDSC
jgi:hypothetical protein